MNHPQALPIEAIQPTRPVPAQRGLKLAFLISAAILAFAWYASTKSWYLPGDDVGYYLGLAGGSMMLLLLLYPVRKHIRLLQGAGGIHHWFRIHMLLGIFGPLLIVVHSAFYIGSLNAAVAMFCMLLVATSGVVGRFMYARIHHGLYGRKATLEDMQESLGIQSSEVRSKFHFVPKVEDALKGFNEYAQRRSPSFWSGGWKFMTLSLRARLCRARCQQELRRELKKHAAQRQWDKAKLQQRLASADLKVGTYLEAVRHAAQFSAYERLFSLWHILHVPFVFMLVISGVVHVIYVHMY